jgi:hypothetical protein
MGVTHVQRITEGMCKQCAWERIKLKCKICGETIGKGYPRLLAHTAAHYTSAELLYNEDIEENIILINFEISKTSNKIFSEDERDYTLRCKICRKSFLFKKEETMFSKWIDHIKSHYMDKDLVKKGWIAKDLIHLNYDSVIQMNNNSNECGNKASSNVTYCDLTERESKAYRNALHRIRNEESITKSKRR